MAINSHAAAGPSVQAHSAAVAMLLCSVVPAVEHGPAMVFRCEAERNNNRSTAIGFGCPMLRGLGVSLHDLYWCRADAKQERQTVCNGMCVLAVRFRDSVFLHHNTPGDAWTSGIFGTIG